MSTDQKGWDLTLAVPLIHGRVTDPDRRAAVRVLAGHARDAEELQQLLSQLDLHAWEGK